VNAAVATLIVLLVAGVTLLGVELAKGNGGSGATIVNPCKPRPPFAGSGIDATIQRIVLDGLDGAACRLGTSREQLVLSLRPGLGPGKIHWTQHRIQVAVRAGMLAAVNDAVHRGDIPAFVTPTLRQLIQTLPLEQLIRGAISLKELIG
jgi:hypothetical protein